jgi:hypothetical protein
MLHLSLLDDSHGELVPECSWCERCFDYYRANDPRDDDHAKVIQDDMRCDAAVAVAGEVAETYFRGDANPVDPAEQEEDRRKARNRASAIHLWKAAECCASGKWATGERCVDCDSYLAALRATVASLITTPRTWDVLQAFAEELSEKNRIEWDEVSVSLRRHGLVAGCLSVDLLPPAPFDDD